MEQFPCDEAYLHALGRAVFNYSVLEYSIAHLLELLRPGYLNEYRRIKHPKTAGAVAADFRTMVASLTDRKLKADLEPLSVRFDELFVMRNDLLHANPASDPDRISLLIKSSTAKFIAWAPDFVQETATKFEALAIDILAIYHLPSAGAAQP